MLSDLGPQCFGLTVGHFFEERYRTIEHGESNDDIALMVSRSFTSKECLKLISRNIQSNKDVSFVVVG